MELKFFLFFSQFICFCNLLTLSRAKALIGENVRQIIIDGELEFVVSIGKINIHTREYKHFCTGTLVSNRDVITAAHCLRLKNIETVRVVVGSRDIRRGRKMAPHWWKNYNAWAVYYNMSFPVIHNDIAIIRLKSNVTDRIVPGVLSDMRHRFMNGYDVMLAGWGRKEDNSRPNLLETVDVTIIDNTECQSRVNKIADKPIYVQQTSFCTKADPIALVNRGDSGGPVMFYNTVVGITLGTIPFPEIYVHPGKMNVHLGIYRYRTFIYDNIYNF